MMPQASPDALRTAVPPRIARPHRWLLLIPFVWQIACVPLVNDVAWRPLGLPFPMAWQMAGVLVASILIAVVFAIDGRNPEFAADVPDAAAEGPVA